MASATPPYDPELQEIAAFAAETLGAPVALLSALGDDRQAFLAEVGFGRSETGLEEAFCARALDGEGVFEVSDASADPRFAGNPLVTGPDGVRFYAGVPVASPDGGRNGALCVLDRAPRTLTDGQRRTLAFLARQAEARLRLLDRERSAARAEAEARRSAELLRLVTERVPVRICYVDREYRLRFLNDAYLAQVGLDESRALGRTLAETLGEPMFLQAKPFLDRALAGETHVKEFEALYNTGPRPIRATYVPDRDAEGRTQGVAVQVEDLTAQRAAEDAARAVAERLDETLRTARIATFDWDVLNDRVFGNELMAAFYGFPNRPEGNPVAAYFESVHLEDRDSLGAAIETSLATGARYEAQYRLQNDAGQVRWVLAQGDTTLDEDGRASRLTGVLLDVTERVEAEVARQESERRLRVALEGGRMGTWDVDLRSGTMICSETCKANYGRRTNEPFSYDELFATIVEEDRPEWERKVERAIEAAQDFEIEYRVRWPDGTRHWVQVRGTCVADGEGRVVGLSGVSFDVTERARVATERERLLVEVEMEQAKLRNIFEQAPAFIAVLRGRDLVFEYVNRGYYQIVGDRPLLGRPLVDAIPEATGSAEEGRDYDRLLLGVMDSGERLTFGERPVMLRRDRDGPLEERFLDLAYLPLRETDGTVSGVLVHGIDVTDGVLARRAVAVREELFRTVFEQAPDDAILVMDRDRTLTGWNPAAGRITGWAAAEAIGGHADLIFSPEDRSKGVPAQETEGAARTGKAEDERWHMRRDGTRFWGSGTMNALHDAEGNVTGFLKVFRDATARYEEARTLAFLARLTETLVDLRDAEAITHAALRLLGEHLGVRNTALGEISEDGETATVTMDWGAQGAPSVAKVYRIADFPRPALDDLRAGRLHVSRDAMREYASGDGLEAIVALGAMASAAAPVVKEGRFCAYVTVISDVPRDWTDGELALLRQVVDRVFAEIERARAESALQTANDALEGRVEARTAELAEAVQQAEGFNYSISHDLRTPLRAIVSTASILRDELGPELDEEHRELLERQVHNASRMGRLIDELLRLSRYARVEVKRQPLDMTAKARSVAAEVGDRQVEVQEGMTATGDPDLVRTVLQNLIGNACKFSPGGGTVRVRQAGGVFSVADEGVGFDMAFAPKVFLPFERLVGNDEFEGTGIGLANVKRIVERHGGRVWAESVPGEGATFFFTLDANS